MDSPNPCQTCGACCAAYRVSFYWGEAQPAEASGVPIHLTEKVNDFRVCMKGTNTSRPFCVALTGKVGEGVSCLIYQQRPSPCREFGIDVENGEMVAGSIQRERCNQARSVWGLAPLFEN